jgi:hypothetical protein
MCLINTLIFVISLKYINKDLTRFLKVDVQLVITHESKRMLKFGRSI